MEVHRCDDPVNGFLLPAKSPLGNRAEEKRGALRRQTRDPAPGGAGSRL